MGNRLRKTLLLFTFLLMMAPASQSQIFSARAIESERVVFVCQHGSVKSLISASLFNRTAEQRGLPFHAISRGVNPEEHVPPAIVAAMHVDGFEVEAYADEAHAPVQSWDDVPPASIDYAAARSVLQQHIDALLDELQKSRETP